MTKDTIGIDISKDGLDAHRLADGAEMPFANNAAGITALTRWIGRKGAPRIVFEPTGSYHRRLESALTRAGMAFVKVNPRHARRFVEAHGAKAKTDRADAAMLARMGAALELEPRATRAEKLIQLTELVTARRASIKDRTATKNRSAAITVAFLQRQNANRLKHIETDLEALDREIALLIGSDVELDRKRAILTSIPGLSDVTAAALIAMAPELGTLDQRQIAALAGLAPITRQSGRWHGKAFIRGGRADLRSALYMPALASMRFNPDITAFAARLKNAGKPAKVVITAVMRKLVILANACVRDQREWLPKAG